MADVPILNRKKPNQKGYLCGYSGRQAVGIYADSLYAAKQLAVEHFRPKKKEAHLVWVELADETNPINLG